MYAFYADESGMSQSKSNIDSNQPVLVISGILIDLTKINKAFRVYNDIMKQLSGKTDELKFKSIMDYKYPYYDHYSSSFEALDKILSQFEDEVQYKIIFSAINLYKFEDVKKDVNLKLLIDAFGHPYLCASYDVLFQLEKHQVNKEKNKGNTFVIFDEQVRYATALEDLITKPFLSTNFTQIIDTCYFGKSHHSKLIQIADLYAGMMMQAIKLYVFRKSKKEISKSMERIGTSCETLLQKRLSNIVYKSYSDETKDLYNQIEIGRNFIKTLKNKKA